MEIDATKITIAALQKEGYEDRPELVLLAALELAKADASRHFRQGYRDECDQEMNDARAKLYKELQR